MKTSCHHPTTLSEGRQDIDLSGDYSLTLDQQQFLLHQDANLLIFTTEPNLRLLSNAETIYMDGTFKASPQIFEQLYSIHTTYRGHVVPVVYALLPDKLRETYHSMFDALKRKMAELDLTFNPQFIISDFEASLIPTLRHHFPNCDHHGCYFHHTQAIWRNVQRKGLQKDYEEDQFVRRSACSLMALAFLPTDQIMGIFTTLQQQPVVEGNNQLQALYQYYYDTWLTGPFPLELPRTNNMVEGWHSRLNRYVRRLHPNLHQLVKELQKEQAMTQVTVQRARLGGAALARRMKYVRIDEEVQRLTQRFDSDDITVMDYIAGLRRVIHHY